MRETVGLTLVLAALWLGFSGYYKPLILLFGAISIVLAVYLAKRMRILDFEGAPYARLHALIAYWGWLIIEIAKANRVVIGACLSPKLNIDPALVRVKTRCQSDLAKTVFANSITLTPGTVSLVVDDDTILVHALYASEAVTSAFDDMDRRASAATDGDVPAREVAA